MQVDTIYRGDCLDILSETFTSLHQIFADYAVGLPKQFADVIYMDPPFFSNRIYEKPWKDTKIGFTDNEWGYSLAGLKGKYLTYMKNRIQKCHDVLKQTGSFYLHCDWHAGHYLKQICDDIFGYENFQNEIIWHYRSGGASKSRYSRKHDNIFFYTKSNQYTFNPDSLREPYAQSTIERLKHKGAREKNPDKNKLEKGRLPYDVWTIEHLQGNAQESLGYPTQKPETLLERIIKASSNPNEIVLDPFCGCGTTLSVAHKLGRHYVGIELSEKACIVVTERLKKLGATPKFHNSIYTVDMLKNLPPMSFQDYIIDICLKGHSKIKKTSDKGIDGFTDEGIPIQVKQSSITRPVLDEFETAVDRYYNQLGNTNKIKKGVMVGYGVPSDGFWREQREAEEQRNIIIRYMSIENCCDILNDRMRQMEQMEGWDKQKHLEIVK